MRKATSSSILFSIILCTQSIALKANAETPSPTRNESSIQTSVAKSTAPYIPFTGRVIKNKVRVRLQPTLDSLILRELNRDDLLIVTGESDDFYIVQPPKDVKAYVFRTFVLDNVIEGSHVNVRLEPNLEAPVIAQLNSGDRIDGTISPLNSKWIEFTPPASARLYVAKDFVEKIGDASKLAMLQKRREELNTLLDSTNAIGQLELQKTFPTINLDGVINNYNIIIAQYTDFPAQVSRAKEELRAIQESYLQKKISYLENKTQSSELWLAKNSQLNEEIQAQKSRVVELEQRLQQQSTVQYAVQEEVEEAPSIIAVQDPVVQWEPIESSLFDEWSKINGSNSIEHFYQEQSSDAVTLIGVIEPYSRAVKNKPGDYLLVNQDNNLPMAYLYSTQVNLQNYINQGKSVRVVARPNNNFAYPAYFVLSVD